MLFRISLVIAILAALAVGGLNFVKVKEKVTLLRQDRDAEKKAHDEFEGKFTTTKDSLDKTNAILKETQATLATTTEEKTKAVAEAEAQTKRADKLNDDLTKTRAERDDAQNFLAQYKGSGLTPEQALNAAKTIKGLQDSIAELQVVNKSLDTKATKLQAELNFYINPDKPVLLPASLKGKVIVSDPKWNFVVLNVGENQGLKDHGQLLVNRNGKLVAKVIVSSMQKDRAVANVMPGWQLGEVMEGDQVIPAYPES